MKYTSYIYSVVLLLLWVVVPATTRAEEGADSLVTYIAEAIRNNPAVMGQYRSYQAMVMDACGEGQLNAPEFSVSAFPSPMQHVNVKQYATFSVMQMFPWFGTLKAGRQIMEQKAEAAYQEFRENGIALAYDVQKQWYDILAVQEQERAVREKIRFIKDIREVALYQYKSPSMAKTARMSDQLRLETEQTALEEQAASLADKATLMRQQFNLTLHRNPDSPLVMPDSITLRQMPVVSWEEIERLDPQLNKLNAQTKVFDAQQAKAKAMGMPMIGVGVEYMLNGKVNMPMMADMNGDDMIMPMVKITLPIFRRKTNAMRKSAQLAKEAVAFDYQRRQDILHGQYLSIAQRAADELRKIELYDKQTAILDNTLKLMQTEYANGSSSLTDILSTTRQEIDYALQRAMAKARYNMVVAEYEKMASKYGPNLFPEPVATVAEAK